MDVAADRILREAFGISYARFLALFAVELLGPTTQRELATWLALSEPSISRTVPTLQADGYLEAITTPGDGNRRSVRLTPAGQDLVKGGKRLLEKRFATVVRESNVDYDSFHAQVEALLNHLSPGQAT
jgi:DNA-binding MarR family transcriptional regulator